MTREDQISSPHEGEQPDYKNISEVELHNCAKKVLELMNKEGTQEHNKYFRDMIPKSK